MCFSATASFVAGGSLGAAGIFTITRTKNRAQIPLAAIPLLCGLQQCVEGIVWISFGHPRLHAWATLAYVMFSHVLWPTYIPLSVMLIEPQPRRKKILSYFLVFGIGVSLYLLYYVLKGPVSSAIVQNCVEYQVSSPDSLLLLAAYAFVICAACLISSQRFIKYLGAALFLALAISLWSYRFAYYSVWCFFAAILSLIIFFHLVQTERARPPA